MIRVEKHTFNEFVVFYRTVDTQYIVYEIYSLLIALFHKIPQHARKDRLDTMISKQHKMVSLEWETICTNSIMNTDYIQSMVSLISSMDVSFGSGNDSHNEYISLLAANCSLDDKNGHSSFAFNYSCYKDTGVFWVGYSGRALFDVCMTTLFSRLFMIHDENMMQTVYAKIMYAFQRQCQHLASSVNYEHIIGHMIQIFVPINIVDEFAFPSVEWGYKVDVFELKDGDMKAEISKTNDKRNLKKHIDESRISRKIPFSELLRTKHLSKVQGRIYGHPKLFLNYGAHCRVYHGCPTFDTLQFRHDIVRILYPFLELLIERQFNMTFDAHC
jgi:hypothetical protein